MNFIQVGVKSESLFFTAPGVESDDKPRVPTPVTSCAASAVSVPSVFGVISGKDGSKEEPDHNTY